MSDLNTKVNDLESEKKSLFSEIKLLQTDLDFSDKKYSQVDPKEDSTIFKTSLEKQEARNIKTRIY